MTMEEVLIGAGIGLVLIAGAVIYALRSTGLIGPGRNDVSGGAVHTDSHVRQGGYDFGNDSDGD